MTRSASIRLKSDLAEVLFEWLDFDGDDCFGDFQINIRGARGSRHFEFGECAVFGLRKLSNFFKDTSETTASGGFRHPDICGYEVHRSDDDYLLVVEFAGRGTREEFPVQAPLIQIEDEFLGIY